MIELYLKFNKIIGFNMSIYKKNQPKSYQNSESPHKKRLIEIAKLANYEPVASIPNINNDFNFTYAKDGHLKRKQKSLNQTTQQSIQKNQRQSPVGTRLPRIESKVNKIEYHPTNASQQDHLLTLDTRVQTQQIQGSLVRSQVQSPIDNRNKKSGVKRIAKMWLNARQKYVRQDQGEEQSQDQYESHATPGPGYYSVCDTTSTFNVSRRKNLTDFSFGSRASRFIEAKLQPIKQLKLKNPEQEQEQQQISKQIIRRRKVIPFLSCSLKKQDQVVQKVPGPQDYFPRQGIQEELIRKIQRNFRGNFGVCEGRFKSDDRYAHLGPGSYSPESQKQIQKFTSYFFKSEKKRFN